MLPRGPPSNNAILNASCPNVTWRRVDIPSLDYLCLKTTFEQFEWMYGRLTKWLNNVFDFCFLYWKPKKIRQNRFLQFWNVHNCSFLGMSRNVMLWIKIVIWLWRFHLKSLDTVSKFWTDRLWPLVERLYNRWKRECRLYRCLEKWPFVKKRVFAPKRRSREYAYSQWLVIHVNSIFKFFSTQAYTWYYGQTYSFLITSYQK